MDKFGNSWKDVSNYIKTRSTAQIRSHAQKYYRQLTIESINATKRDFHGKRPIFAVTRHYRNKTQVSSTLEINNIAEFPKPDDNIPIKQDPIPTKTINNGENIVIPTPCYSLYYNVARMLWYYSQIEKH